MLNVEKAAGFEFHSTFNIQHLPLTYPLSPTA